MDNKKKLREYSEDNRKEIFRSVFDGISNQMGTVIYVKCPWVKKSKVRSKDCQHVMWIDIRTEAAGCTICEWKTKSYEQLLNFRYIKSSE